VDLTEEVTGYWRRLHHEELHNLCSANPFPYLVESTCYDHIGEGFQNRVARHKRVPRLRLVYGFAIMF